VEKSSLKSPSDDVLLVFSIVHCLSLANPILAGDPVGSGTTAMCAKSTVAANFSRCAARMKTVKSQWNALEPTRCEAQYYSNNADDRGEYRIDVVVVANKAERERTAEMDSDCCCLPTRRWTSIFGSWKNGVGFAPGGLRISNS
jgi:hypothetical protein